MYINFASSFNAPLAGGGDSARLPQIFEALADWHFLFLPMLNPPIGPLLNADELAKFFGWFQKHTGLDPLQPASQAACKKLIKGALIIVRDGGVE